MKSPSPITKGIAHSNNTRNIPKIFKPIANRSQVKTAGAVIDRAMKKSHSQGRTNLAESRTEAGNGYHEAKTVKNSNTVVGQRNGSDSRLEFIRNESKMTLNKPSKSLK